MSTASSSGSSQESQDNDFNTNTDDNTYAPCSTDAGFTHFSQDKRLSQIDDFYCPLCESRLKHLPEVLKQHFNGHINGLECTYCKSKTVFKYILFTNKTEEEHTYHKCRKDIKDNQEDMNMNEVCD